MAIDVAALMQRIQQPLPVLNQQVDPAVVDAGRVAARAQLEAVDIIRQSEQDVATAVGASQQVIQQQADADAEALIAKQQREAEQEAVAKEMLAQFGGTPEFAAQRAAELNAISARRQELGAQITAAVSIDPLSNPLDWLTAQFTTAGLVNEYNAVAAQQNALQDDTQARLSMAASYANNAVAAMPAQSEAEKKAALQSISANASLKILDADIKLANNRNQAAMTIGERLQANAGILASLDEAQRAAEARNHQSLIQAYQHEASKFSVALEAANAAGSLEAMATIKAGANAMGLSEAGAQNLLKAVPADERELLSRFFYSGKVDSLETARAVAKYTNRGEAQSGISEMADMMVAADQTFWEARSKLGTTDTFKAKSKAEQDEIYAREIGKLVGQAVQKKMLAVTPAALQQSGVPVATEFPELKQQVAGTLPADNVTLLETFIAASPAAGQSGKIRQGARRFSEYNQLRVAAVQSNTTAAQAGISLKPELKDSVSYPGLIGGDTEMTIDLTKPEEVERWAILRKSAPTSAQAIRARFGG